MSMPQEATKQNWDAGDAYEPYVGRWSRRVASEFLAWLARPAGDRWLDVGCGTGALTDAILRETAPVEVVGVDPSEAYLTAARERVRARNARFLQGDAESLDGVGEGYDAVVSGLVLNFVPDPAAALTRMKKVARRGGVVAAYVWDYAERMELMRAFWDAAVALDPAARALDEGARFPICRPETLDDLFGKAGLRDVTVRAIDVPTVFRDFDDYWTPFLGGQGPAPGYAMSLSERQRADLRARLAGTLPQRADGSIHLVARAWAVAGVA